MLQFQLTMSVSRGRLAKRRTHLDTRESSSRLLNARDQCSHFCRLSRDFAGLATLVRCATIKPLTSWFRGGTRGQVMSLNEQIQLVWLPRRRS